MKRIFVTGADKALGKTIITKSLAKGFEVHVFESEHVISSLDDNIRHLPVRHNIAHNDMFELRLLWQKLDIVVHSDIYRHFDSYDARDVYDHNVGMTEFYVNLALESGIQNFVFVSSAFVFQRAKDLNTLIDENTELIRLSGKGLGNSILRAELEVWRASAEGLPVRVLNPSILIGDECGSNDLIAFLKKHPGFSFPGSNGFVELDSVARSVIESLHKGHKSGRQIINTKNQPYNQLTELKSSSLISKRNNRIAPALYKYAKWLIYKISNRRHALSYPSFRLLYENMSYK